VPSPTVGPGLPLFGNCVGRSPSPTTVPSATIICLFITGTNAQLLGKIDGYIRMVQNMNVRWLLIIANIRSVVDVGPGILNKIKNMILRVANTT
jgi:hypothetical protein